MNFFFLPRGIRNNNPGNIRLSKVVWQGQKQEPQQDLDFVEFISALYGLRALMKTLLTYHLKYGLDTVESLINRYAPPHENATDNYIYGVAKAMGVKRTDKVSLASKRVLLSLVRAIVVRENGPPPAARPAGWYDASVYEQAAAMVLPVNA